MKKIRYFLILFVALATSGLMAQESRTISGTITDGREPLENVSILNGGDAPATFTDAEGKYSISAKPGDLIEFSYTGMKTYKVRVEDVTRFLNMVMIPDVEELEEVTVKGSNRKSQEDLKREYRTNPNLIQTAFGIINAETAPGRVQIIDGRDINPINICVLDFLRNRFAGISVRGDCQSGGAVIIRGAGSIGNPRPAVFDIDGQIFSEVPLWLDLNSIKRMAIARSIAFNVRYGAVGGGGIIIINTISGQAAISSKIQDLARLRNNYVSGEVLNEEDLAQNAPTYLRELKAAGSLEDAKRVYYQYETQFGASPHFYLDALAYFSESAQAEELADEIMLVKMSKWDNNASIMKALAYQLEVSGRTDQVLERYKDIFVLRPHYSQSYLDLARAYRAAGETGKAAAMYARYKYLLDEGFLTPSEDFGKIIQHESDNLLALEGNSIGADRRKIKTDPYVDGSTRVVIEWNDSEAEFELQFVNPEGQYTTWKHTYADMEDRILDEKDNGYSVAEFVIDENLPGTWTVNAIYRGNKSLTPTYLKVTTYTAYGERSQREDVQTFKLQVKDVNQRLFSLNNPGSSRVR